MPNHPQTTTDPAKALGQTIADLARRVRRLELLPDGSGTGGDGETLPHTTLRADTSLDTSTTSIPVVDVSEGFAVAPSNGIVVVWSAEATCVFRYLSYTIAPTPSLDEVSFLGGNSGAYDAGAKITFVGTDTSVVSGGGGGGGGAATLATCRVKRTSHATIASGMASSIDFDSVLFNTDGLDAFDPLGSGSTGTYITLQQSGYYIASFNVAWAAESAGQRQALILLDSTGGAREIAGDIRNAADGFQQTYQSITTPPFHGLLGDAVRSSVFQNSGSDLDVLGDSSWDIGAELGITRIA